MTISLLKLLNQHEILQKARKAASGQFIAVHDWIQQLGKTIDYDFYVIYNKTYSKRTVWGWAKRKGLVAKLGTSLAKEVLITALGGVKIIEPSKIKFEKNLDVQ